MAKVFSGWRESGGLHLMLRDPCQDVSCCRLFCFYHMRCVFSRCIESQRCSQEPRTFLSIAYAAACERLKIKHLLFKTPLSIFGGAPGQRANVQSLKWRYRRDLVVAKNTRRSKPKRITLRSGTLLLAFMSRSQTPCFVFFTFF